MSKKAGNLPAAPIDNDVIEAETVEVELPERINPKTNKKVFTKPERDAHVSLLKDAVAYLNDRQFQVACLLRDIAEGECEDGNPFYTAYGYADFKAFCEGELEMSERKGYYLLGVVKETANGALSEDRVRSMPWTKVTLLAEASKKKVLTDANAEAWYSKAESLSYRDLRKSLDSALSSKVKTVQKKTTSSGEEINIVRVGLFNDQYENWQLALQKAKVMTNSDSESHLTDTIATCFLSDCYDSKRDSVATVCARFERSFGIKIVAIDPESMSILFGEDFASNMNVE